MSWTEGDLAAFFDGVAIKKLSRVEADITRSNQHEFNGVQEVLHLFGKPEESLRIDTHFFYLSDEEQVNCKAYLTLYDARAKARKERGVMRTEYRLYFSDNDITQRMKEEDCLILMKKRDGSAVLVILQSGSTILAQMLWLFGETQAVEKFRTLGQLELRNRVMPYSVSWLLESLGIEIPTNDDYLDEMVSLFGSVFPETRLFAEFARSKSTCQHASDASADKVIAEWVNSEARLFLAFEKYLLQKDIESGLTPDLFISKAKSYLNRRKARAGQSLENHLEQLFKERKISYSRTPVTEGKSRPDFIFPGIREYHDKMFPSIHLRMLGVKTTCKDRWRQVLVEADRIAEKHLLTLEPAISVAQTDEMRMHNLQLVVPEHIRQSYKPIQQNWLMNIEEFIGILH